MNLQELLEPVSVIARTAGAAILEVYQREDHGVQYKDDASPLTLADLAAHERIVAGLNRLTPHLPVLSEESAGIAWSERCSWTRYWLVDPLDGTKEFINRNGEFTVNIALVEHGVPVLGVVYAPVPDVLYCGAAQLGAWKEQAGRRQAIRTVPVQEGQRTLRVVASRRHAGEELGTWIDRLQQRFPALELLNMGSSLKICLVAEGSADLYPRLAPTCEWDTAAAQAVLEAAGGALTDTGFMPYRYNTKDELLNPHFLALGDPGFKP